MLMKIFINFADYVFALPNWQCYMDIVFACWICASEDIKDYFSKYGTVLECNLKTDPSTGRSRGFAFVLFDSASSVDKVGSDFLLEKKEFCFMFFK